MRAIPIVAVAGVLTACAAGALSAQELRPATTGGIAALDRALQSLTQNKRVLVIGAHPDDEDTELLALLARGHGAEAAYLSLSRGEGGQNLIGAELGEALGIIRSQELLAARALDGARQFFTRGFDFGYSRSLEETERFWPRDTLLADALRVIRRFRPQIVVSVWSGTPRDGHGQHQASGAIAHAAFAALRDSAWGPRKLYRSTRFESAATTLTIPSGTLDPVTGQSFHQIAMASRSRHRSQDMGRVMDMGPSVTRLALVERRTDAQTHGRTATERADAQTHRRTEGDQLFAGVDTTLPAGLERYTHLIDSARAVLTPRAPERIVPLLAEALGELRRAAPPEFLAAKEHTLEEAIATAAGVVADALIDDGRLVPGQAAPITALAWNAGSSPVNLARVTVSSPAGWSVQALDPAASAIEPNSVTRRRFAVAAATDSASSTPYFLARPRQGGLYDWSGADPDVRGEPFGPPLLSARIELNVAGTGITLEREVVHRYSDQAIGEMRRPVIVVPAVGVALDPEVMVLPTASPSARTVTVTLTSGRRERGEGEVRLEVPAGWPAVPPQRFAIEGEEAQRSFGFTLRAPRGLAPGSYTVRAIATHDGGRSDRATVVVDYPHIRPVASVREAVLRVEAADLRLPPMRSVGYVRGASDLVPEALRAVGLPVVLLEAADLARGDLSRFDAIVIGSRAYETHPALVADNVRLLDYVRAGGRLIVQYQQYAFIEGGFAPFPLRIAQPHDRVTDETAPVRILDPADPVFLRPNRITDADWAGWVQERGLYFARSWDDAYRPLIESGDNGAQLRGGLLVAQLGRGTYVYTGLAFFRQLPAGVPGAYRLFANLLAR